ncbi:MAG: T9SS type A sorting domain-containing protein [Saprospiraceae bacterium]
MNNTTNHAPLYRLIGLFLLCSVLFGNGLLAQQIDFKLEPINTCDGNLTIDLKVKASDNFRTDLFLGNTSILLEYDPTILDISSYQAVAFDGNTSEQAAQAKWLPQKWTNDKEFGLFNLVLFKDNGGVNQYNLSSNRYIKIGTLVLDITNRTENKTIIKTNPDFTNFYNLNQKNISPSLLADLTIDLAILVNQGGIGASCDDGDDKTENDVILADCSCAGTPIPPTFDCPTLAANIGADCNDANPNTENDKIQLDCSCVGTLIPPTFDCPTLAANIGDDCNDANANTENDKIQPDCSCAGTPIPPTFDCPTLSANIGDDCDDSDATTENDVVQVDCSCAGTPIGTGEGEVITESCDGNTTIIYGNGQITMSGQTDLEYFYQVLNESWQEEYNCGWQCGSSQTVTDLAGGNYRVYIKNSNYQVICEKVITVSAGNGGGSDPDNDNDGIPASQDCDDNDANLTVPGTACNDGNVNTENDVVQADCSCIGRPIDTGGGENTTISCGGNTSITYGNGQIKMEGLETASYFFQILNASWQQEFNCGWNCGSSQTVTGLAAGDYRVYIKNSNYQIICEQIISVSADNGNSGDSDPDNDNDGVPASQDCDDNNANLTTVGATCNDGNVNTENDIVQADCTCAGTPIDTGGNNGTSIACGETTITYGDGTIQIVGQTNTNYYFKINDLNAGWAQVAGCGWNCGSEFTATGLANSTYLVSIYQNDWAIHCNTEITITNSSFRPSAGSRNAPQLAFSAYGSQRQVALEWATNTGWKNSHFEIERSLDGLTFETIGEQLNEAMADDMKQYKQADISPLAGTNYYRIKQVYMDGSFEYTETQQIDFSVLPDFGIYPNPANEVAYLNLKAYQGKAVDLVIYNQFGQSVFEQTIDSVDGEEIRLDTRNYDNGLYLVKIATTDRKSLSKKLVIARLY